MIPPARGARMAGLEIKIDDEMVKSYVAEAILKQIDGPTREKILAQAVATLLKPEEYRGYGAKPKSPLEQAFEQAVHRVAHDVVREDLEKNPAIRDKIRELYSEAMRKVFEDQETRLKIVQSIADAMSSTLSELKKY